MVEENNAEQSAVAQTDDPYTEAGSSYSDARPGHTDRAAKDYNYKERNVSNMSDRNYANQNYTNQNSGNPNYANQNYGNQNYANQNYGNQNYAGNIQRGTNQGYNPIYGQGNYQGNQRGNIAPYGMRGSTGNYSPNAGYGRQYMGNYENNYNNDDYDHYDHYDHDDDNEYYYQRPSNYGYGPYCFRPPGMGRNRMYQQGYGPYNNRQPQMGGNWMSQQYYQGQPYFDGYGPGGMGPWGRVRNWFSYNPVTNWARSPRGNNFLRGLGIATAGLILAPAVVKTIRPLAVQAVHGVMSIVGEVKGVVSDAKEELEDIFADAKWENLNDRDEKLQEGE